MPLICDDCKSDLGGTTPDYACWKCGSFDRTLNINLADEDGDTLTKYGMRLKGFEVDTITPEEWTNRWIDVIAQIDKVRWVYQKKALDVRALRFAITQFLSRARTSRTG